MKLTRSSSWQLKSTPLIKNLGKLEYQASILNLVHRKYFFEGMRSGSWIPVAWLLENGSSGPRWCLEVYFVIYARKEAPQK